MYRIDTDRDGPTTWARAPDRIECASPHGVADGVGQLHHALLEHALLPRTRVTGRFESLTSAKPKNNAQNAWESGPAVPTHAAGGPHNCRSARRDRARSDILHVMLSTLLHRPLVLIEGATLG